MDSQDYAYDSDESDEGYGDDGGFESVLVRQRTQAEWQVCVPRAMELRGRLREHFSDHPLELRGRLCVDACLSTSLTTLSRQPP